MSRAKGRGEPSPFIREQADSLRQHPAIGRVDHFLIPRGGIRGYLTAFIRLVNLLKREAYTVVHGHHGITGFLSTFGAWMSGSRASTVITFHGSDLNKRGIRQVSRIAARMADVPIVVSARMSRYLSIPHEVLPCGIEMHVESAMPTGVRKRLGIPERQFMVLFSSGFDRPIKDPEFAFEVVEQYRAQTGEELCLLELRGYSRMEVYALMRTADALLMCSVSEGSPQVIKEALLNGLPIVSNDVGDVAEICEGFEETHIIPKDVARFTEALRLVRSRSRRVPYNPALDRYDNGSVTRKLVDLYRRCSFS